MILFFVERKCFKISTKSLFDAYFGKKSISEMVLQEQQTHYEIDTYNQYSVCTSFLICTFMFYIAKLLVGIQIYLEVCKYIGIFIMS